MKVGVKGAILTGVFIISIYYSARRTEFDVTIVNSGDYLLRGATVKFDGFYHNFGYLTASKNLVKSATYGGATATWPMQVEVSWIGESTPEVPYKKIIKVRPKLAAASKETLELMIRIENDKVCAYPKIWSVSNGLKHRFDQDEPCQFE